MENWQEFNKVYGQVNGNTAIFILRFDNMERLCQLLSLAWKSSSKFSKNKQNIPFSSPTPLPPPVPKQHLIVLHFNHQKSVSVQRTFQSLNKVKSDCGSNTAAHKPTRRGQKCSVHVLYEGRAETSLSASHQYLPTQQRLGGTTFNLAFRRRLWRFVVSRFTCLAGLRELQVSSSG